ncbi:MarR family transcriptional regulator [Tsukamurella tyrosinosolvens]|uniref:DNA-binding transcriptional regulator, MarR family n=1 Tax=Tsukamurella tyrosinosolvens TaxID=57704 RepID=A0A1H4ZKJ5_TSUTY|nr:MarR family transcriptional regulator [Tsukamurella tyrosinosolvens]KXO95623.1 MarR family transcriptional regulator [Tsukamurella tyrosinosolvens]KXP07153.1 MarR family transcriptional regulator [Tsukamurella tyrosinosolvens]KZL98354.1 MarR family transcriptional regulator [Tsukamurella tyrosinosolvens]MCA4994534.1 MarR family transcriptional regulator [Tsukamurella tyrosinosolvens]
MSVNGDVVPIDTSPCTPADDALAEQWHRLMRDYSRMTCALDRALAAHELTSSEFEVLEQLERARSGALDGGEKVRMADLAEHVHLSQSALSRLVARLEKDGLATRTMCQSDRRSVFTSITDSGRERYDAARPTQRAVLRAESAECEMREYLCGEE